MWQPLANGGEGSEYGTIVRDEEHSLGARITLERGTTSAPYAIPCGIYGWMVHTRFFSDESSAVQAYEEMKIAIEHILELPESPMEALQAFLTRFP